jgi:O-antigen ligase
LFLVASLPLLARPGALRKVVLSPLAMWCAGYLVINAFWFALGPTNDLSFQTIRERLVAVVFLLLASIWFTDARVHRSVRNALGIAVVLACAVNVYDLFHPLQLSIVIGRAAGLYINPNIAAAAILFMTVLAYDGLSGRRRMGVLVAGLIGVLLTASRGAALTAVAVLGIFWLRGRLRARQVLAGLALLVVAAVGGLAITGNLSTVGLLIDATSAQRERLSLGDDNAGDEMSTETRRKVAERAIEMFLEHPVAGAGLGATARSTSDLTHNMYLMFMAEYGAVGAIIFPALVVAVTWGARGEMRTTALASAGFLTFWALFSHNVLDEFQLLLFMALLAGMCNASAPAVARVRVPRLLIGESPA